MAAIGLSRVTAGRIDFARQWIMHARSWCGQAAIPRGGKSRLSMSSIRATLAHYPSEHFVNEAAMLTQTKCLPRICAFISTLGWIAYAFAGDVKLVSDTWDEVCRVEVTWGPNAPESTPVEQFLDVKRNWSITRPERLCYRRASTPDNCDSGMTQWNTQWKCAASAGAGTEQLSLQ